jgi:hypothetical protein
MIPQTQYFGAGLFDRLARPEWAPRNHEAKRRIADRTRQVPNAVDMNTEDDRDFADDDIWFE